LVCGEAIRARDRAFVWRAVDTSGVKAGRRAGRSESGGVERSSERDCGLGGWFSSGGRRMRRSRSSGGRVCCDWDSARLCNLDLGLLSAGGDSGTAVEMAEIRRWRLAALSL